MQFLKPEMFVYFWSVPFLIILFFISRKMWKARVKRFGSEDIMYLKLIPHYRKAYWFIRLLLLMLVLTFIVVALARPQWGEEKKKIQRKGVDLIFMLDTSLSMLAEDIKPSRLVKAKVEIKSFVHSLKGDRIGMVAFAGSSFLQAPLTLDYSAFFLFLDAMNVGYIPDPGTSLPQALKLTMKSFPAESLQHKAIILFTDGEDHEEGVGLKEVITTAKEQNVRIYTIGVGTVAGEPIPLKDELGRRTSYKKDRSGQVVVTKLNSKILEEIAAETGGVYFPSTPGEQEVELILKHLETLGKRQLQEKVVTEKEDHYQLFLALALLFLICEMFVRNDRKRLPQAMGILLCFFLLTGFVETPRTLNEKGNALFQEKKYQSALEYYRKAQVKNPEDPSILYNLAATLYELQEYQEARKHLEQAVEMTSEDAVKAKTLYNYGNTLYRLGNFEQAIKAYEEALKINPDDEDAKYNLEFLQKTKNKFEKENQNQQQQSKDQNKQQNEQQDQQDKKEQEQNQQQKNQDQKNQQENQENQQSGGQGEEDKENKQDQKENEGSGAGDQEKEEDKQGQGEDSEENEQGGGQGKQDQEDQKKDEESEGGQQDKQDQEQEPQKNEQGGGGQGEEDQEDQQKDPQSGDDQKDKQEKPSDQPQNRGGGGGEEEKEQPQQGQEQQDQKQPQGGGPSEQEQQRGQGQQPEEQQQGTAGGQGQAPLQGQMTKQNALRILDALKDGERELQDLRRPPSQSKPTQVLKDW